MWSNIAFYYFKHSRDNIYSHSPISFSRLRLMENRLEELRRKYKEFKKGEEDPLKVKDEVRLVLEEARKNGKPESYGWS